MYSWRYLSYIKSAVFFWHGWEEEWFEKEGENIWLDLFGRWWVGACVMEVKCKKGCVTIRQNRMTVVSSHS